MIVCFSSKDWDTLVPIRREGWVREKTSKNIPCRRHGIVVMAAAAGLGFPWSQECHHLTSDHHPYLTERTRCTNKSRCSQLLRHANANKHAVTHIQEHIVTRIAMEADPPPQQPPTAGSAPPSHLELQPRRPSPPGKSGESLATIFLCTMQTCSWLSLAMARA